MHPNPIPVSLPVPIPVAQNILPAVDAWACGAHAAHAHGFEEFFERRNRKTRKTRLVKRDVAELASDQEKFTESFKESVNSNLKNYSHSHDRITPIFSHWVEVALEPEIEVEVKIGEYENEIETQTVFLFEWD